MSLLAFIVISAIVLKTGYYTAQKRVSDSLNPLRLSYYTALVSVVALLPFATERAIATDITLTPTLTAALVGAGIFNAIGLYAFVTAVKLSDLSGVMPLRDTIPIYVAFLEPIFLGTTFTLFLFIGALLAGGGAYIILADDGILSPLRSLPERGYQLALVTALSYSFGVVFARYITQRMPALTYTAYIYFVMVLVFGALIWVQLDGEYRHSRLVTGLPIVGVGLLAASRSAFTFEMYARVSATAGTIFARGALISTVLIGVVFLNESGGVRKVIGSLLIMVGVVLSVVSL